MVFDGIMIAIWIVAATQLAIYAECPAQKVTLSTVIDIIDNSTRYCPALVTTIAGGYISTIFYIIKLIDGIRLEKNEQKLGEGVNNTMFARGNWKPRQ